MRYVIIGGSAAGVACAEIIRRHDKEADIALISDESFPLYSRCLLTYLIAGSIDEDKLYFKNKSFYQDNKIEAYLGKKAISIDVRQRIVFLQDGISIRYDKLLLATGARAKSIDASGVDRKGVFTVRNIADARAIIAILDEVKQIAVLGGGLIGLRDAYAIRKRQQKEVTVVVKSPHVLSQMLDREAAQIIAAKLEQHGIRIKTSVAVSKILGKESVEGILLDSGEKVGCQLVIIGKGVQTNTELASSCGLKVEEGIAVDKFLRTSDENIFAAGDCAQTFDIARETNRVNALWPCAVEQGQIAALNMLGKEVAYQGSLSMNSVDFFGLGCISAGVTKPKEGPEYEVIAKTKDNVYKKFVLKENRIVGAIFVGDIQPAGIINPLIKNRIDISSIKHILLSDKFDYAKVMPLVAKYQECFRQPEYKDTIITY
jgi:NAD(P)H-nitrite reductase large subunit